MASFGIWQQLKHNIFFFIAWIYRSVWTIIAMLTFPPKCFKFQEITEISKCSESPEAEHFAIGNVHCDNLPLGIVASKQLQEGLIVFSDNILHFLKIKKKFAEFTKTILWL